MVKYKKMYYDIFFFSFLFGSSFRFDFLVDDSFSYTFFIQSESGPFKFLETFSTIKGISIHLFIA